MSKTKNKGKTTTKSRSGKRKKRSHFKRHRVPIISFTSRKAFKAFQYSYGYYCYKGRKRIFKIMPFNRKVFKK